MDTQNAAETSIDPSDSIAAIERRHDLDALRAFAMLLGIGLHGAISFIPGIGGFWGIQDRQAHELYGLVLASIHGWRMPLFFLISGYFTTMLWKKRGLGALIAHRVKRILLPLMLSMVTVIPLLWWVAFYVRSHSPRAANAANAADAANAANPADDSVDIWAAVAVGNLDTLEAYLMAGGNVNAQDPFGSTPLHIACFFGQAPAGEKLLDANANIDAQNKEGRRPEDLLSLDWKTTAFLAAMLQVPVEREDVMAGRAELAKAMEARTGRPIRLSQVNGLRQLNALLFHMPVFQHLWFLWFLCWLVCGFAVTAVLLKTSPVPSHWLTALGRYAWLIPLTAIPQFLMTTEEKSFGPATSIGLLPLPAVLAYYAIFFGYGALYFGANDKQVVVGRGYGWKLAVALLLVFPMGISQVGANAVGHRVLFAVLQVAYAWLMSFAMIGLFHQVCRSQRPWVRYLSDSSYWLYLVHIPLVMLLQFSVRDLAIPSLVKFIFICGASTILLLASYQLLVRNTWIGVLLNGRRYPRQQSTVGSN